MGAANVALLESSDGSGWSHLAVGDVVIDSVPTIALASGIDPDPTAAIRVAAIGWIAYDGSPRFLRADRSIAFDHEAGRLVVFGDEAWHTRIVALLASTATAGAGAGADAGAGALTDAGAGTGANAAADAPAGAGAGAGAADGSDGPGTDGRGERVDVSTTRMGDGDEVSAAAAVTWRHDDAAYLDRIDRCLAAIRRGDSYQLCLTNLATVTGAVAPWMAYSRLRAASPTHRAGFLRLGDRTLVSASPERFVSLAADGTVSSSPIKGTRPRGSDGETDAALAVELRADEKELAENLMIVDLVRNDLSRIADVGSVAVDSLFAVESYPQVHQLVSTVSAQLLPGLTIADVVAALFPAGSMTGAPKHRAMELLAEFENDPRGLYAGAFGLVRSDGSAELAMTIRGAEFDASGAAYVGAGGGITALSRPDAELAEMKLKAAPILRALGAP